jgi:cell wall-associated NlpC family hydrolase
MHLRNANPALYRLADRMLISLLTGALIVASHSAMADEATSTYSPAALTSTVATSTVTTSATASPITVSTAPMTARDAAGMTPLALAQAIEQGNAGSGQVSGTLGSGSVASAQASAATQSGPRPSFLAGVANKAGDVVEGALNLIGVRYRWGGDTPDSGLDCSGFVRYVYQETLNFTLPRQAAQMSRVGEKVSLNDLKPGDLVFFNTIGRRLRRTVSHVGIYIGHDKFVHSPSTGSTIRVDEMNDRYWETRYLGARRLPVDGTEDASSTDDDTIAKRLQRATNMTY